MVTDSALVVIAIELGNSQYIEKCIESDYMLVEKLKRYLSLIENIKDHITQNEANVLKKKFLLSIVKLLQFMACFVFMPYEAIAYAMHGAYQPFKQHHFYDRHQAHHNIQNFYVAMEVFCDPEVNKSFLSFYRDYLNIIDAQAIRNNPLNPDQIIHNPECLSRVKKAYATLNREFYRLFQELKKYGSQFK